MPKPKTHVVFVGDSYIVRFEAAIEVHPDIPQDLKLSSCRASFVARRGAKVETIAHMLPAIGRLHPDVVFLQAGGNNISHVTQNGVQISNKIEALVNDILSSTSCKLVYVGELLFRYKGKYLLSTAVAEKYNAQVHEANGALKAYCQEKERVRWWSCKGVKQNTVEVMHRDGVHLSATTGMFRYYKSLRGVIVHAMNRLCVW